MAVRKLVSLELSEWRIEPTPSWVEVREVDWNSAPPDGHAVAYLLIDEQHHVATQSLHQRHLCRLLTHAAVQERGQVEFEFDPAAHRLLVHEAAVWRRGADGTWVKRSLAERENFLLRQREHQLEQQMLHGRASLVGLLEDVRLDDVIELSWTLESRDLLPGLHFTALRAFAWTVPVAKMFFKLQLSPHHPVRWRMHTGDKMMPPAENITEESAVWCSMKPDIFLPEQNVPGDHWAFPMLEVTGWETWSEIADFTANLWSDALSSGASAVAEEAERLRGSSDLATAARAAIRFVQDDVRYLAVDFGHGGGLLPNGAGVVLRRRFGDCKDKSVLLAALLRALGIDAHPLLVNTGWREAVYRMLPSPSAFNHVIVTFILNGRRHFIDATMLAQGGDFENRTTPPYGRGLEVRTGALDLQILPDPTPAELTLTEIFELDKKQQAGFVEQHLEATSWMADEVRAALLRQGRAAFFKVRFEELQKVFPALVEGPNSTPTEINDNTISNRLVLRSRHDLPTWGRIGEKPPQLFKYGAHGLSLAIEHVDGTEKRRQPWALRFPMVVRHRVIVRGKAVKAANEEKFSVTGPGFCYSCAVSSSRRQVTFDYEWRTTAREIKPEQWKEYCEQRARAFDRAGANVLLGSQFEFSRRAIAPIAVAVLIPILGLAARMGERDSQRVDRTAAELNQKRALARAWDQAKEGRFLDAEPSIERLSPQYAGNFDYQVLRAKVALGVGKLTRAREAIATARLLRPGSPVVQQLEMELFAKSMTPDDAAPK